MITFRVSVLNFRLLRADLKSFLKLPETAALRHMNNQRALLEALLVTDKLFDAVTHNGSSVTVEVNLTSLQCDALWLALPPKQPYSFILDTLCKAKGGCLQHPPIPFRLNVQENSEGPIRHISLV